MKMLAIDMQVWFTFNFLRQLLIFYMHVCTWKIMESKVKQDTIKYEFRQVIYDTSAMK